MINTVDPSKEYHAKLLVQGNPVTFLLDTGASASLLPKKYVDTSKLNLGPTKTLEMWNGTSGKSCGTANLLVTNPATNRKQGINFDLVAGNHKPILGVVDELRLNLVHINLDNFERVLAVNHKPKQITKGEILKQYEAVFSDKLGTLEGDAHALVYQ